MLSKKKLTPGTHVTVVESGSYKDGDDRRVISEWPAVIVKVQGEIAQVMDVNQQSFYYKCRFWRSRGSLKARMS